VGLRVQEFPIDLWLLGISLALGWLVVLVSWNHWIAFMQSLYPDKETLANQMFLQGIMQLIMSVLWVSALFIAAVRRPRTGRV